MNALYRLADLRVRLGDAEILHGMTLEIGEASLTAIVGPNGAGKSTLMSVLSGVRESYQGACVFRDREITDWPKRELARQTAFIPQTLRMEFPFTAEQVVFMGRTPYCDGLFESREDREAVRRSMETTDTLQFAGREFRALSGGEKQRVILASALAQRPSVLLLDEPTTFLDLRHQIGTYALLQNLAREGVGIVAVTHDLNLAASYSDRMIVLSQGRVAADGSPGEVVRQTMLREVFEVDLEIQEGPEGRPWVLYEQARETSRGGTAASRPRPIC